MEQASNADNGVENEDEKREYNNIVHLILFDMFFFWLSCIGQYTVYSLI
jgi:hypothetical protein